MKTFFIAALLAATVTAPAFAQNAPPPGPRATPSAAQRQQMRANFQHMRQLHEQFRAQILGELTPAHRALLAQIAGQLATSTNPRAAYDAGVQRLDAALSASEKQRILADASSMHSKMRAMFSSMPHRNRPHPHAMRSPRPHRAMTAGRIVLMLTAGHGGPGMMMGPRRP